MKKHIFIMVLAFILLVPFGSVSAVAATDADASRLSLKGVRVGFYGDSICAANRENRIGWAGRVGEANQMDWVNHGQGGWAISNIRGDNVTICTQLMNTDVASYDMIILHGGVNDAWDNAPLGLMSDKFSSYQSYNPLTFAGGLERTFAYMREKNPDADVGYIINFKFLNASDGATVMIDGKTEYLLNHMEAYVEMTKQICEKWGIPYLDLYSNNELTARLHPLDVTGRYSTKYLFDFIHPSSEGYDVLTPYVEEFLVDLITTSETSEENTTGKIPLDAETAADETEMKELSDQAERTNDFGCNATISGGAKIPTVVALSVGALMCLRGQKYNGLLDRMERTVKKKIKRKGGVSL